MGANVETHRGIYLDPAWLRTGLHALGPTGQGKTRFLFHLFQLLTYQPRTAIVVLSPKGDLGRWCRDWAIANGLTRRLVWWDPGSEPGAPTPGFDPLKPNGLPVSTHAKNTRAAIQAAWNQISWDQTPQLQRGLYLCLAAAREVEGTLEDALEILRPGSRARQTFLARIRDPFLRDELDYIGSLRDARQEELLASTYARVASFVGDPLVRRIIAQRERSIDFSEVVQNHGITIFNVELYRPHAPDDVELLGRLIINSLLQAIFERSPRERTRVILLIDEVHRFATQMLCDALDLGRELGLATVLAHQYLEQLRRADPSGQLLASVKNDARTKVIFGGNWVTDLDEVVRDAFIDQYDPWAIKDELTQLEVEPIETTREVVGTSQNLNVGLGLSLSFMTQEGVTHEESESESAGESEAVGEFEGSTESRSTNRNQGHGHAESRAVGSGETSDGDALAERVMASEGESEFESAGESAGQATTHGTQRTRAVQRTQGKSSSRGRTSSTGIGIAPSIQGGISRSRSSQRVPWHEHEKRRVVSSRTFLSQEEQLALWLQQVKAQPVGHFVLKVPAKPAIFLRAPYVGTPVLSERRRRAGLERMYALRPYYTTSGEIAAQEQARTEGHKKVIPPATERTRKYPKSLWRSEER